MLIFEIYLQALMDSNLPRLQLELYKEIKKVIICVCVIMIFHVIASFSHTSAPGLVCVRRLHVSFL